MDFFQELDPSIQQQLRLQSFEGKFDVKDFIGGLSERLIAQSKAHPGPFDPKPFIHTLDAAVDRLIALRGDVQTRTEQMEKSVKVAEREYSKKMSELNRGFDAVGQSFSGMERKMNEVGRTAIRIGEELESVHHQRQRAQAAYDLIDFYNQFTRDDTSRIDALKKQGKEGRRQTAVLLRRLSTVAKEVDLPNAEKTRENIDKYCEKFEKEMLHLFDRAYRRGDPKMMHHCAQTLLDFNGGASCVQVYVNQHDFFINRVRGSDSKRDDEKSDDPKVIERKREEARKREEDRKRDEQLWEHLPDPDASVTIIDSTLTNLFKDIGDTVGQEIQIVQAVFPNPAYVMQVFLQRVFAQSIQQQLELLVNKAAALSDLAFLRMLQMVHQQTTKLVEDLKNFELPAVIPRSPVDNKDFTRQLSTTAAGSAATAVTISAMLETAMEELFVPYTEGQRYMERESKSLSELYAGFLTNFTRYHEREGAHKGGKSSLFDRMVNSLSSAAATTSTTGTSTTSAQAAAAILNLGGFRAAAEKNKEKTLEEPVTEEAGQLHVVIAETMLKWHAEAVGRCVELSAQNDVPKNIFSLLRVLAAAIANSYLETAIETAQGKIDPKAEPNLQPLTVLRGVDLISHLWQQYVNVALLPLASASVTVRREMVVFNNQTISRIEGAVNKVLQLLLDSIISWLSQQLAKQKKNDFKPRNDDLSFARVNTEPCVACCEMLEKVRDAAKENLSGKNLEVFLTEIGVEFHRLLLEHLKKYPVSATGGLMLAKDLKLYQDTISTFSIPSLHERFEFLRQLGNVFLISADILTSYITEGYLGRISEELIIPYLEQRSDWSQASKFFNNSSHGPTGDGGDGKSGFKKLSINRLSTMINFEHIPPMNIPSLPAGMSMPSMPNLTMPSRFTGN